MGKYWRYIKILLTFRDVTKTYKEENGGASKPGWVSRRFWGGLVLMVTLALKQFGVDVVDVQATQWADTLYNASTGLLEAYGVIMVIVGGFKRNVIPEGTAAAVPSTESVVSEATKNTGGGKDETVQKPVVPVISDSVGISADADVVRSNDPGTTEQTNPR